MNRISRIIVLLLVIAAVSLTANAQEIEVKGTIYDLNHSPALSATVEVLGAKNQLKNITTTDINGKYSIKAELGDSLIVNHVGYKEMRLKVTSNKMDINLAPLESVTDKREKVSITGTVFDENNSPTPGVNVIIISNGKLTRQGTNTDGNGKYTIDVSKGDSLRFMYVGYNDTTVKVQNQKSINVTLKPNREKLSEAVIMGFDQRSAMLRGTYGHRVPAMRGWYPQPETEEYQSFNENGFLSALLKPLSTFSLDVDAASYSNVRRMLNESRTPDKDAVRVEEMINYFSYNYPTPKGSDPVSITTEATTCPWNKKHQLVRIGVKAKEIPSQNLPKSNFVFLIDVSGSMSTQNKLPLVISSMKLLVNNLRPTDRVAIVTYAGAAGEALPSTPASDKQKILDALSNLEAGGSTAGGAGIQLAYKIAEKNFVKGGNNRVILCSDGDFNVGVSSTEGLESLIESKRKTGIYLTVLGYGMGNYKDNKLQTLSQKGNGNHAYIDNIQEANRVLVKEFGSTMYAVAKDVKLQVEFNPAFVNAYRLIGYETRLLNDEDFNDDTKDAGELGAGHTVTALYEIVPKGVDVPVPSVDKLKYQEAEKAAKPVKLTNSKELLTVKLRYKNPSEDTSRKIEVPVLASKVSPNPSADFNFAMAVAMFGQLLRDSDYKGTATYDDVIRIARKGLGDDPNGYRREFIRLAEVTKQMQSY